MSLRFTRVTVAVEALTKKGHENRGYNITYPEVVSSYDIANILSEKDQIYLIEILGRLHGAL